jgi:hypothetical protein
MERYFSLGYCWLFIKAQLKELYLKMKLQANWIRYKKSSGFAHKDVFVSLTSHPPRFGTLHLTLKSLLTQSIRPKEFILWIAHNDMKLLPRKVIALQRYGLIIKGCEDFKSYTKLIPFLRENKDAAVVIADDDIYYWRDWLKELVQAQRPGHAEVICHRMHRIQLSPEGVPLPYMAWEYESVATEPSVLNFPTGVLGVLYPPHIFHPAVLDMQTALDLCPSGDDIWFYWMVRLSNASVRRVEKISSLYCWRSSQAVALSIKNSGEGFNDMQITNMIKRYGFSWGKSV